MIRNEREHASYIKRPNRDGVLLIKEGILIFILRACFQDTSSEDLEEQNCIGKQA
jgi:hypothetical protein